MGYEDRPVVLVDMDNTLVDYDEEFMKRWNALRPDEKWDRVKSRQYFEIEKNFDQSLHSTVREIIASEDFFCELKPLLGAIEALREMNAAGLQVKLCTSPSQFNYGGSAAGKYQWCKQWLGEDWMPHLIITRDKTVVRGRVLIDDKPSIHGACASPEWTQIIFEQPYNVKVADKPRMTSWSQWRLMLAPFYPELCGRKNPDL